MSLLPNLNSRLKNEIQSILPIGTSFQIDFAKDPSLDAWKGAAKMSSDCIWTTRQDYFEFGSEYFRENLFGNQF